MPMMHERSPDTDAVIEVLLSCNDEISYRDIGRLSNLSEKRAKEVLASARRIVRSQFGLLFGCIRGQGLRRLTDQDKVKKPEAFKKRVMRGAGRELKDLSTIAHFDRLNKAEQHSVTTNRTVLNVIRHQAMVRPEDPASKITPPPLPDTSKLTPRR